MATAFEGVKEWPKQAEPIADRHHNKPPLEEVIPAEFKEALLADRPDFLSRLDEMVGKMNPEKPEDYGSVSRVRVTNDDELARAGTLAKMIRAAKAHVDATHKAVKQPYLDGGRLVDAEKNALIERLDAGMKKVSTPADAYVAKKEAEARAERERIAAQQRAAAEEAARAEAAREQAEREAEAAAANAANDAERAAAEEAAREAAAKAEQAMAAAALAPASPTKSEPVRSDEGATVSGKKEWKSEVTDYEVAFIHVADDEKVREAIDKAIARRVKAGTRTLEGVRIWPVAKASFR